MNSASAPLVVATSLADSTNRVIQVCIQVKFRSNTGPQITVMEITYKKEMISTIVFICNKKTKVILILCFSRFAKVSFNIMLTI